MKKKTLARQTAEMIAEDLFTSGGGSNLKATRLVMELPGHGELPGPGWCIEAVTDRIEETLLRKHLTIWLETKQIQKAQKKG